MVAALAASFAPAGGAPKAARRAAARCRSSADANTKTVRITAPEGWTPPEPKKFTVAEGNLGNVISAAVPLVLRLGTGALVNGYAPSLVDDDEPTKYSIVRFAGKRLAEASALGPRPAQPIEVFEYE